MAQDAALTQFAQRIKVVGNQAVSELQALGAVETVDVQMTPFAHDLVARQTLDPLPSALRSKAAGLLGPARAGQLWSGAQTARDLGRMMDA